MLVNSKTMKLAQDMASEYLEYLDKKIIGEKHYSQSGFSAVDKKLGGWLHEGHLIVIAGRPAMGKSAFAQQLAESVAAQGKTAVMFTLEMSSYEITERAVARRSGVPIPDLKTAQELTENQRDDIVEAIREFSTLPMLVDDRCFELQELLDKSKAAAHGLEAKSLPPLGVVVVDYLQLVSSKAQNRNLEVAQVTTALKRLSKELAVPVIALSQLNRAVESKQDKRPGLSDLRESGNIEQDADLSLIHISEPTRPY